MLGDLDELRLPPAASESGGADGSTPPEVVSIDTAVRALSGMVEATIAQRARTPTRGGTPLPLDRTSVAGSCSGCWPAGSLPVREGRCRMSEASGDLADFNAKRRLFVLPQLEAGLRLGAEERVHERQVADGRARRRGPRPDPAAAGSGSTRRAPRRCTTARPGRRIPTVVDLDPAVRAQVSPDNGWFVFGVVRDPRLRLFSAWQDKYLLRSPGYWEHWDDPAQPPVPTRAADIVELVPRGSSPTCRRIPDHEALDDGHFVSQVHALDLDVVRYSRLYDMSELGDDDGRPQRAPRRRRAARASWRWAGATSRRSSRLAALFGGGVREAIEGLYADDFAHFGDRWDFSRIEAREAAWTPDAFAHAQSIIAMNERIADVVRSARQAAPSEQVAQGGSQAPQRRAGAPYRD